MIPSLSDRETEVLSFLVQGKCNQEVADRLFNSLHTIVSHKKNIMTKLNAQNSLQLGYLASEFGLIKSSVNIS